MYPPGSTGVNAINHFTFFNYYLVELILLESLTAVIGVDQGKSDYIKCMVGLVKRAFLKLNG